jgi:hypothetical protein
VDDQRPPSARFSTHPQLRLGNEQRKELRFSEREISKRFVHGWREMRNPPKRRKYQ